MDKPNKDYKISDFEHLVVKSLARREFIAGTVQLGLASFALSGGLSKAYAGNKSSLLSFNAVASTGKDTITLPDGYNWDVVVSWGDPLFSSVEEFNQKTRGTSDTQKKSFGDNNDGMHFFPIEKDHGVLVVNNEYINLEYMVPNKEKTNDDILKTQEAVGLSILEVKFINGQWKVLKDAPLNRKVSATTPILLSGPASGHELLKTEADPSGTLTLGTWANCGQGETPWGTYLTCEENFNGYFASSNKDVELNSDQNRYGIRTSDWGYEWYKWDKRFDVGLHANEPNRCGYIVEVDPFHPNSTAKKRTALGRFKHENAEVVIANNGQVVVYMGDDERGEFLYKFVSESKYIKGNFENNKDLLDEGTLFVAKFDYNGEEGVGRWIELTHGKNGLTKENGFNDQGEILIFVRRAASQVGATTMDRPEWVAAHPNKAEVYCALTNNKNRGKRPNAGGDDTPVNGPNPRQANLYGQIVRWQPTGRDHTSTQFTWDLFAMAGNPSIHSDAYAGSKNINKDNMFNSPDGLAFDPTGRLWIQTDGNYSNENEFAGMGNNQMLCADTETGEIKRFMVGPVACEVTGLTWSTDRKTMFVGIQHPGDKGLSSTFPDGAGKVPRSSVIAIRKNDGGVIGT